MEKKFFSQESFYLQGILNDINEQDTSFLDCKHRHMIMMMKSEAPPDKVGVMYGTRVLFKEKGSRVIPKD